MNTTHDDSARLKGVGNEESGSPSKVHAFPDEKGGLRLVLADEIEAAHAEALELNAKWDQCLEGWTAYTDKELDVIRELEQRGYLTPVPIPELEAFVPPPRHEFHAALHKFNPSVNVVEVSKPIHGDVVLLRDSAHHLTCTLDCERCMEEYDREEYGRGLGISGRTQTVFGPKEGGKTWYAVLAAKEAIQWGYNVLHYEADDSRESLPSRLILAGVDPLDVVKHVRVITGDEIQVTGDGSKRRPETPNVPDDFARNVGVVTLDAVISMAAALRLDSSAAVLTKTLMATLMEPFYRRSRAAHGIIVDHSGHDNQNRPMDSAQKLAAVRVAYQARTLKDKPLGKGRFGCVELILQKDSHSIHPGKRNDDTVAYLDVDARGETVRVELYEKHPDKRSATPTKLGEELPEVKRLIHEWLMENADDATATEAEIKDGLRGVIKRNGKRLASSEVNNNLNRLKPGDPIQVLSDGRYRAL
ncbi:hypothetical protein G3I61_28355 [Streptomyces diastaticus]|nr:hypothetical protein [Streptomyces diastaticus]